MMRKDIKKAVAMKNSTVKGALKVVTPQVFKKTREEVSNNKNWGEVNNLYFKGVVLVNILYYTKYIRNHVLTVWEPGLAEKSNFAWILTIPVE